MVLALLASLALILVGACGGDDSDSSDGSSTQSGDELPPDTDTILAASAQAMGQVESVAFLLERGGAPVYIDDGESLAVDNADGRVAVPGKAEALIGITINDSLSTQLGAIAVDGETWLSNPITGEFEPLPPSYDIDPTLFFDPQGGWQPLIEGLVGAELLSTDSDDGYHIRGTAPAENIEIVTARLVKGQDVVVDLWIDPNSALVNLAEFDTESGGETTSWSLRLSDYGADFEISPPDVDG
ncbi:MAG: LppX_LprAFG lipoprotein [Acidimicrobiales bacterium]